MQLKDWHSYKAIIDQYIISSVLAECRLPSDAHNKSTLKGCILKLPHTRYFHFCFPVLQYSIHKIYAVGNLKICGN